MTTKCLADLVDEFVKSLRPDQMPRIVGKLSPDQELQFRALLSSSEEEELEARVLEQQGKDD